MIKIGILGSDNSHALLFSKLCNIPDSNGNYLYDDVRITAIYGFDDDPKHTKEVAESGHIEFIAENAEDLYNKVDAVMVVYRHGKYHVPHILPFIEKGYPVWIDKPIAVSMNDIKALREAVLKNNTLITGGSTLKYNHDILTLKNKLSSGSLGKVTGGSMNFPGDLNSKYDGLFFYGSHLCEMCLTVFGYDIISVSSISINAENILVTAKYDGKIISLNYNANSKNYLLTALGTNGSAMIDMDISVIYRLGFEQFVRMLKEKRMILSFDNMVKPIYMLNAIVKSLNEKREVYLNEITE